MRRATVTRRTIARYVLPLPPLAAVSCGTQAAGNPPPSAGHVKGKVVVMSYQTSSPKLDMQVALYDEFNREFRPKGLEVAFVNPGQSVIEKVTALHVTGTPADMFEWPRLWRELEGIIGEVTPLMRRDKIDEKQRIPETIEIMKDSAG